MSAKSLLVLFVLSAIWGGSFLYISLSLNDGEGFGPFTVAALRPVGAVAVLSIVYTLARGSWREVLRDWPLFLFIGSTNIAIPHFIFAWGQQHIDSGLAAILNSLTPIATIILAILTRQENFSLTRIIALIVGVTGVVLLVLPSLNEGGDVAISTLVVLLPAVLYAIASVVSKKYVSKDVSGLSYGLRITLFAAIVITPFSLIFERPWTDLPTDFAPWFGAVMLALVATAMAYPLYFWLIKAAGATNTTVVTMLVPIFAIPLGAIILDEVLGVLFYVGTATVLVSLVILDGRVVKWIQSRWRKKYKRV